MANSRKPFRLIQATGRGALDMSKTIYKAYGPVSSSDILYVDRIFALRYVLGRRFASQS